MLPLEPYVPHDLRLEPSLLAERRRTVAQTTLPHIYAQYLKAGRVEAPLGKAPEKIHFFYDSDMAKLLEAFACCAEEFPNPQLQARLEAYIDSLLAIQEEDGYINSYFHHVNPEGKWRWLHSHHELYCAGHLIEAAIAWHQAFGRKDFLDAMCRYADLICERFGPAEEGKVYNFPGHQEIELALYKLYRYTGEERYLRTSEFFVRERGRDMRAWREELAELSPRHNAEDFMVYAQAHLPPELQETAEGHAVRACYYYCAVADIAHATRDAVLADVCRKLWDHITQRRMNVAGGIGSTPANEGFTRDFDLPEEYYYETCAQIALFLFSWRLAMYEAQAKYVDVMELTLYNSILSGLSADGKGFFYSNPLLAFPREDGSDVQFHKHFGMCERVEDFACSCCPPNVARLLGGLTQYMLAQTGDDLYVNLYIPFSTPAFSLASAYPFGNVIELEWHTNDTRRLYLRIPGWCRHFELTLRNRLLQPEIHNGYVVIGEPRQAGDRLVLSLDMPAQLILSHPDVYRCSGMVAIRRGPLLYCLEEVDNGKNLFSIRIPGHPRFDEMDMTIGEIRFPALRFDAEQVIYPDSSRLYCPVDETEVIACEAKAIPYFLWGNRGRNRMRVWFPHRPVCSSSQGDIPASSASQEQ
ncbi:MAG: glycoside hydrolase family 127 protein [Lentisphaerae bacterium]|nr:MAG: glycoside hydrolase family 127 protein [Lentisphaerota bacterium]